MSSAPTTKTDIGEPSRTQDEGTVEKAVARSAARSELTAHTVPPPSEVLWGYFLLTYAMLLLNTRGFLSHVEHVDIRLTAYAAAVQVAYTLLYLSPVLIFVFALHRVLHLGILRRMLGLREVLIRRIVYAVAIVGCTLVQYAIFADKMVFHIFGFHLNGFVWNLVFTRGGIDSMGGGSGTMLYAVLVGIGFLIAQAGLLVFVWKLEFVRSALVRLYRRKPIVIGVCCATIAGLYAQLGYGISTFRSNGPTLAVASAFPCFVPTTFTKIATSLGYEVQRTPTMAVGNEGFGLQYPLHDIRRDANVTPPNIVWLVSESLRADMLDPEIMPNAWDLSKSSSRFEHHYSGGNGTRMGMFSMFYGLYGPYWFPFLAERRGPVLVDAMVDLDYQMDMYTSAMFSYPEFDKTLFSRIPSDHLHEGGMKPAWRQDKRHIDSILRFIDQRDESRPFATFMFFEAPHANYSFSKRAIIRRPFADELNYVSMDLKRDIGLIKNRYINSSRQVDISIGRVLDHLRALELLDSTIVIITGDHGEEFMEKGRWGHNSEFTEEQTLVPLVFWVPGKSPRVVTRLTSHLDIPATIMPLLGVLNPAEDYSQGYDLFGPEKREFTVIGAWNHVAFIDEEFKATFPTSAFSMFQQTVTTRDDVPVADRSAFYETHQESIVEVMRGLNKFRK
jgi:uncharacterized protein